MGHAGGSRDTLKAKAALSSGALLNLVDSGQETIRCNFTPLAADVAALLGQRLVDRGTVRSLDLCYCELGATGVEALAASLARPSGLRQLSLGANALTARGAAAAAAMATGLKRLDLEINQLGDEGCKLVSQKVLLRVSCTLQHLDLGMNSIGTDGASALASALRTNSALTRLDLGYNHVGSAGAEAIAQALMTNTMLKVLRLEDNAVGDLGATALVSGAARLQELELAFNQVRAEGAVAVAAALRSHAALRRLGLEGNELRDAGASALAAAISKNCGLEDLSLRGNVIGSAGGGALAQALRGNWRMTALDVTENAITQEAAASIGEMTRQARVVREEELRPPSSRELAEGMVRRFPTEWSVRAWLGWLCKDASDSDLKTLVAVAHAAAALAAEAESLSYDQSRLRDLASVYGRRLAPAGRLAAAQGAYLLNLTPFGIQATVGKSSKAVHLKENSGALLAADAATLRLTLSASKDSPAWLPQAAVQVVVCPVVGEQALSLKDAGDLRVLSSRWRAEEGSHAQLITLLWSWPQRLRGIRFHDLSFWWQGARVAMQGEPVDVKSAITRAVLPDTALAQCSLAELYNPGPVQTFVSHHWSQDVDELFKSLSHCNMRSENTRLWICAFSNNHWSPPRDDEQISLPGSALTSKSCQSFALVLGTDAQSLRRLWCLHEVVLAAQVRGSGRSLALKLCSPQGLLSEGTGGMPISYILKVSASISTLDLRSAECESLAEKEMLLGAIERLAGSVAAASSRCRQLLQDGLSVMHQRGQQIFVQAVSWLNDAKMDVPKGKVDHSAQSVVTGDADSHEPLPEASEAQSRGSSKTSSPGYEEEPPAEPEEEQGPEEEEEQEPEVPAGRSEDGPSESEEFQAAVPEAPAGETVRQTSAESWKTETEETERRESDAADARTESSFEEAPQEPEQAEPAEATSFTADSCSRHHSSRAHAAHGAPEDASGPSSRGSEEGPEAAAAESEPGSEAAAEDEGLQEADSEEDESPGPPRKRKPAEVEHPSSKSEGSESEASPSGEESEGADEAIETAPVIPEMSCQVPAEEEEDDTGLQQLPVVSVYGSGRAFLPLPGALPRGSRSSSDRDSRKVESDIPEMDDGLRCRSPSFSPDPDVISCFSFGDTREKAGYMTAASESLDHEFAPDASAWREEDLHFSQPAHLWPPPAPHMLPYPSDARELADTVALTVMSSSFSRGVSLDQAPGLNDVSSPKGGFRFSRGVSLEQEVRFARMESGDSQLDGEDSLPPSRQTSFRRGFTDDDLAATLLRAFESLNVERLPIRALLTALGRSNEEAAALEQALQPHLRNSEVDGCVSCDELIRWLAMPT